MLGSEVVVFSKNYSVGVKPRTMFSGLANDNLFFLFWIWRWKHVAQETADSVKKVSIRIKMNLWKADEG